VGGYTKFSDRFRKSEACGYPPANTANTDKVTPISYDDIQKQDKTFAALAALAGGQGQSCIFSEPAVIAPAELSGLAGQPQPKDEPLFDRPWPERRGLVERRGGTLLHFCVECGAWGAYGYGCTGDDPGRWYCCEHRPDG
jgi:hypothetical protein